MKPAMSTHRSLVLYHADCADGFCPAWIHKLPSTLIRRLSLSAAAAFRFWTACDRGRFLLEA